MVVGDAAPVDAEQGQGSVTKPIRRGVCNGMSASGVPQARSLLILRHVAKYADVIYGSEFANLRTDELDPLPGWDWVHDPTDPAKAGSFFAVRRGVGAVRSHRFRLGCPNVLGKMRAERMRSRWLLVAGVQMPDGHEKDIAAHGPPKRNWAFTGVFMAAIRARRADWIGGDMNRLSAFVASALGKQTRGIHVLVLAGPKSAHMGPPEPLTDCPGQPDHIPFIVRTH